MVINTFICTTKQKHVSLIHLSLGTIFVDFFADFGHKSNETSLQGHIPPNLPDALLFFRGK